MTGVCTISAIRSGDPTAVNWRRRGHPAVRGNAPDQARPGGGAAGRAAARREARLANERWPLAVRRAGGVGVGEGGWRRRRAVAKWSTARWPLT